MLKGLCPLNLRASNEQRVKRPADEADGLSKARSRRMWRALLVIAQGITDPGQTGLGDRQDDAPVARRICARFL